MVSAEGMTEDGKRLGRLWGNTSSQWPLSQGVRSSRQLLHQMLVSPNSATIDTLCNRNSWEKNHMRKKK